MIQVISGEMKQDEIWGDVVGYEGLYRISTYGRVLSKHFNKEHLMKLTPLPNGGKDYLHVCLSKDGKAKKERVHRLVAECFLPNPEHYSDIDHIDGDGTNNRVENLRWCSHIQNLANPYTRRMLRLSSRRRRGEKGELKDRVIAQMKDDVVIATYQSVAEIRAAGFNDCCVYLACAGKRKTHAGFQWKYISTE